MMDQDFSSENHSEEPDIIYDDGQVYDDSELQELYMEAYGSGNEEESAVDIPESMIAEFKIPKGISAL